jgi:putative tryptophan/tyrosine transport system substrate-binding protein
VFSDRSTRRNERRSRGVGYLSAESPTSHEMADFFRDGLKQVGYVEGQTIQIEYRWAAGQFERLPALATELVDLKVDFS